MTLKTECGIFGIIQKNKFNINKLTTGLKQLQNRGQESWGISWLNNNIKVHKEKGLVKEINDEEICQGIGHVRYSTSRGNNNENEIQPLKNDIFSLVHNGNINFKNLDKNINDSINLINFLSVYYSLSEALIALVNKIPGVYCLLILTQDKIYACRDSFGIRPLCFGKNENGICVASESAALGDYKFVRNILPGEVVKISHNNVQSIYRKKENSIFCVFEYIYFLNPKSIVENIQVDEIRDKFGRELAKESNIIENSIVIGSPNSGILAAQGYAKEHNLPYYSYLKKIKKTRSFIQPSEEKRKLNTQFIVDEKVKDKIIILVDDSLVRGHTIKKIINLLKNKGAKEVHVRIASPPIIAPCYYGIDIPTYTELMAHNNSIEEIKEKIQADSLIYLSLKSLKNCINISGCYSCFENKYNQKLLDW